MIRRIAESEGEIFDSRNSLLLMFKARLLFPAERNFSGDKGHLLRWCGVSFVWSAPHTPVPAAEDAAIFHIFKSNRMLNRSNIQMSVLCARRSSRHPPAFNSRPTFYSLKHSNQLMAVDEDDLKYLSYFLIAPLRV